MGQFLLATVEFFALVTALNGLQYITSELDNGYFATLHNSLWFIFAILTNIFGLAAILIEVFEGRGSSGDLGLRTLQALQYHYFFAWMDVLVGYSALVTQTWLTYHPFRLSHIHLALIGIPIVAWLKRKSGMIVLTTQFVTILAILSHVYVSVNSNNWWALIGAVLMALQLISISLPTRYTFFVQQFSTREAAILLSGVASFIFPCAIAEAARFQKGKRKIFV